MHLKRRNVKEQTPDGRDVEIRVTKLKWRLGNFSDLFVRKLLQQRNYYC